MTNFLSVDNSARTVYSLPAARSAGTPLADDARAEHQFLVRSCNSSNLALVQGNIFCCAIGFMKPRSCSVIFFCCAVALMKPAFDCLWSVTAWTKPDFSCQWPKSSNELVVLAHYCRGGISCCCCRNVLNRVLSACVTVFHENWY